MADLQRVRRQQIMREAEGYLELLSAFADRWPVQSEHRNALGVRILTTLDRLDCNSARRPQTLFLRGQALRMMERFLDAVKPLEEAAKLDPENVHIWLALGWCHKRLGRLDLAIQALEEALAADPEEAIVHYNLACYWSLANNAKLSVGYLSRAFELDPRLRDLVPTEPDFDPIRKHPHFQALVSIVV